jgi:hypothetical protein
MDLTLAAAAVSFFSMFRAIHPTVLCPRMKMCAMAIPDGRG